MRTTASRLAITVGTLVLALGTLACGRGGTTMSDDQKMVHMAAASPAPSNTNTPAATPATAIAGAQEFTVNVGGSGFSPASLEVKNGQPVRIHFKRDNEPTCADEVVFADLDIRRALRPNATATVELTPTKEGDLTFACGMNMLKGKLVVSG